MPASVIQNHLVIRLPCPGATEYKHPSPDAAHQEGKQPAAQPSVDEGDSMSPADDGETPMFIELVEKHGFNPFALSTEIAKEITSATKTKENHTRNSDHIPRDVAQ
jgi:hypothetical protein